MTTTLTAVATDERRTERALSLLRRVALSVGMQLLLWSRRHVERAGRAEQARRSGAATRSTESMQRTFSARASAGPRWSM